MSQAAFDYSTKYSTNYSPYTVHKSYEAKLLTGIVLSLDKGTFHILVGEQHYTATCAASCFLQPQKNDTVLMACLENGTSLIIALLQRDTSEQAHIALPQKSVFSCSGDVSVRTAATLSLEAQNLAVNTTHAEAHITSIKTLCDTAELCCRTLSHIGQKAVSVFRSFTQCLGESHRMVQGNDETHCVNALLVAEENATVMSKNSVHLAKENARTDAKLIQLG